MLPIVMVAWVELNFVRGWMMVLDPMVMRRPPVSEALSAMTREEESDVGDLGPEGMTEERFEDDILSV